MQIIELILYGVNKETRKINFECGNVNIITGRSKTGKSSIGEIINYCLGGNSCKIADGVVRETVSWYGLLLQFDTERVFVARKAPDYGRNSSSAFYYEIGESIESPLEATFKQNSNVEGIEALLSRRLGISENCNTPPLGQTRKPLEANIRHSLYYCFQNQDEIASKNILFHRQSEDFITQAIRDTMPYFLGIINENMVALKSEKSVLLRKVAVLKRELEEIRLLSGSGSSTAIKLISEAKNIGLISRDVSFEKDDYDNLRNTLELVDNWVPVEEGVMNLDRLSYLQKDLEETRYLIDGINEQLRRAKEFASDTYGYSDETLHQKMRLQSIGLFDKLNFDPNKCPFCSSNVDQLLPSSEALKRSIEKLNSSIENISREKPKLSNYIYDLEREKQKNRDKIVRIKAEIDGIYSENKDALRIRDMNSRRAKVVGRVSLWLESVKSSEESKRIETQISKHEERIEAIELLLSNDKLEERKSWIEGRLINEMTKWAKILQLEHMEHPYRMDMTNCTVVVDKFDRAVPLSQLGSGSNWVGIHLIAYFALHNIFITNNRPVPRFIFIDQPSQVYFPADIDERDADMDAVRLLYNFIFDRVNELSGNLQVILVDHAYLNEPMFEDSVIGDWRKGEKLIPENWYQ